MNTSIRLRNSALLALAGAVCAVPAQRAQADCSTTDAVLDPACPDDVGFPVCFQAPFDPPGPLDGMPVWPDTRGEYQPIDAPSTNTSVVLAFRGATTITAGNLGLTNANALEFYGDLPGATVNAGISFLNNDATWKPELTALNGSRFYQVRMSMIGNAATNLAPTVSSLGVSFR